ncbi:uncharacterized protein schuy [Drosophila takahashii]|uniref:uncharacterized protein schuy n=1 Tax=Drosophila takahashii TaxID=29030 RepID=UPI003898E49F
MESQNNSESSGQKTKPTEEPASKCCFVITVGSDGLIEISSHNPDSKVEQNGIGSDDSTSTNEPSVSKKQRFSIAVLKEDSNETVDSPSKTPEKINTNVEVPEETTKTEVLPRFVKICNKDLANRPSFVVLEDALARDRIKQDLEQPKLDQDQKSTQVEAETGESCPNKSMASTNTELKDNAVPPLRKLSMRTAAQVRQKLSALNAKQTQLVSETRKKADNSLRGQKQQQYQQKQQQHYPTQQQFQPQQQHQQPLGNNSPYVTISFLPLNQTRATSNSPVMYPCQQFLSAAPSNMSCCSCCSCSNCCPPRATQVCQMPMMANGCCQFPNAVYGSNCCMLKPPDSFPNSGSCCPLSDPSMRFGGQCSQHTIHPIMVTSNCALQQQQPNIPIAGGFGCNHCSPFRMHPYPHHPCCHCPGFLNHEQMYQSQQQQQQPPCVCCPLKPNQPPNPPSKGVKVLKATEKPINCDGVKHIFSKKPSEIPKTQTKEMFKYQVDQENKNKSSNEAPRSIGGAATSMTNSNCTSLYVARFGKTCLVLRPIRTAIMPRLLTKRISRYTSVIAWPAKNIKSNIGTN